MALIRKDEAALAKLAAADASVSTTAICMCELYSGAYGSKEPEKELVKGARATIASRGPEFG